MTGKDFLAQAAGVMAGNHLREIAEWMDKCADLEKRNADLEKELAALKSGKEGG